MKDENEKTTNSDDSQIITTVFFRDCLHIHIWFISPWLSNIIILYSDQKYYFRSEYIELKLRSRAFQWQQCNFIIGMSKILG